MKDDQFTLRLPRTLSRALARRARERGIPRSQLVREAVQAYLAVMPAEDSQAAWNRVSPMIGSLALDPAALKRDALAQRIRAHNWRE